MTAMRKLLLAGAIACASAGCEKKAVTPPTAVEVAAPVGKAAEPTPPPAPIKVAAAEAPKAKAACSYITEQEASDALGKPAKFREGDDLTSPTSCTLETEAVNGSSVVLGLEFEKGPSTFDYLLTQKESEKLTGLGDKSLWAGGFSKLVVLKGDTSLGITVMDGAGKTDVKAKALAVAGKLAPKL